MVVKECQVHSPRNLLRMDTEQAYIHSDLPADHELSALGAHAGRRGMAVRGQPMSHDPLRFHLSALAVGAKSQSRPVLSTDHRCWAICLF